MCCSERYGLFLASVGCQAYKTVMTENSIMHVHQSGPYEMDSRSQFKGKRK